MKPVFQTEKSTPNEERSMHNASEVEKSMEEFRMQQGSSSGGKSEGSKQ